MRTSLLALGASCVAVNAFPAIAEELFQDASPTLQLDQRQTGPITKPTFNAQEQYISTTGDHKFIAPGPGDVRGPCPGLNAMANHNYIPRNGVATIDEFIEGNYNAFGMGRDLGGFLAVYGAVFNGDLKSWSIGGPTPNVPGLPPLLGTPKGMSGSHNKYENDASPMRGDLYVNGNDYLTQVSNFEQFYKKEHGVPENQVNFGLEHIKNFRAQRFGESIKNNPYFFNGPFSGVVASPAAYTFIFRFMGNKSEEHPAGRLDRETLKTFYAISGSPGNFKYKAGWERFPDNWYKRAVGDSYTIPFLTSDALKQNIAHPEFVSVGGNLGKKNSFVGEDPQDLTGGVYNSKMLLQGNNAMCFGFELGLSAAPDLLEGLFVDKAAALAVLEPAFQAAEAGLNCPQIEKKQKNQFKKYPGYSKSYKGYKGL